MGEFKRRKWEETKETVGEINGDRTREKGGDRTYSICYEEGYALLQR
jgi:hypothetical protein